MSTSETGKRRKANTLFYWKRLFLGCGAAAMVPVLIVLVAFFWTTRTRCMLSADFPAGGTLRVYYDHRRASFPGMAGGLRYRVSADGRVHRGWLTGQGSLDVIADVDLS